MYAVKLTLLPSRMLRCTGADRPSLLRASLCNTGEDGTFAAGAFDSLSAVELSSTLGGQLGLRLPGTLAFDYPSVTAMATHVHTLLAPDPSEFSGSARAVVTAAGTGSPQQSLHPAVVQVCRRQMQTSDIAEAPSACCTSRPNFLSI